MVIARRFKNRRSPFEPDRNQLHHVLVDFGMKPGVALVVILSGSATVGAFDVALSYVTWPLLSMIACGLGLVAFDYGMLHLAVEKELAIKLGLKDRH